MNYLVARFREPSTYAGIAAVLASLGVSVPSPWVQAVSGVGVAIAGAAALFLPEMPRPPG